MTITGVIFLGAHPDDETVMAGGTLAMLHEHGIPTHILCATDGRGGESGGVPGADTPEALAHIRKQELQCAVEALQVSSLTLLAYEDPVIGPGEELYEFAADETALTNQIIETIQAQGPNVVLSHGSSGEYGHPAHIQMHRAAMRAVRDHMPELLFYSVAALLPNSEDRLWNKNDPAHLALDITPWIEAKHAAMLCHRTQHALFKRRRQLTDVRDAIRLVETFRRQWPAENKERPEDEFSSLLLSVGGWRPEH